MRIDPDTKTIEHAIENVKPNEEDELLAEISDDDSGHQETLV